MFRQICYEDFSLTNAFKSLLQFGLKFRLRHKVWQYKPAQSWTTTGFEPAVSTKRSPHRIVAAGQLVKPSKLSKRPFLNQHNPAGRALEALRIGAEPGFVDGGLCLANPDSFRKFDLFHTLSGARKDKHHQKLPGKKLVPTEGVEPTRPFGHQISSLVRLPIPPRRPNYGLENNSTDFVSASKLLAANCSIARRHLPGRIPGQSGISRGRIPSCAGADRVKGPLNRSAGRWQRG